MSKSQLFDYDGFIESVIARYQGDATLLSSAIGALVLGRYVGWRVLRVVYSNTTYLKYQNILGIDFKEVLPERGLYVRKSIGLRILDGLGGFWDFVRRSAGPDELKTNHNIFQL